MSRLGTLLRSPAFASLVSRGAGMAGAFLLSVAVLRSLPDKSEAGLVMLTYTLLTVAATLSRFGSDNLALREVSRNQPDKAAFVRHCVGVSALAAPGASLLLGVALVLQGPGWHNLPIAVAAAVGVLPAGLSIVAGAVLRGLGRVAAGTFAELGSPLILAAFGIAGLGLAHRATPGLAVWMITLGYAATALWAWGLILLVLPAVRRPAAGFRGFLTRYRRSLVAFFATTLGFFLFAWLPAVVLGYVGASREYHVALYNAGARLVQFVSLVPSIQISYLSNMFAARYHEGDVAEVNRLSQRATRQALAWALLLGAFLIAVPTLALRLFGDYADAAPTLQVLAAGALLVAAAGPVNGLMLTCGLERRAARLTFALVAASLVALPALALQWGSVGVAAGSAVVSVAYAVACTLALRRIGIHAAVGGRSAAA